ncbi:hypothetical protein [Acinetobacter larvae]|uniref:Uncharacterized protein n=1 Tax=Acinetobacter larvae TaxID=1789224 RepID=A0A1B2LXR7_9GAMM|nr:hypothetical protein [Acinetobacter larvae]AOA57731.1 hypothetical protein BFG52_04730 [Acinetobacter larvae]
MPVKQQKNQPNPAATAVVASDPQQPVIAEHVAVQTAPVAVDPDINDTDINLSAFAQELSTADSSLASSSAPADKHRQIELVQQQLLNLKQDVLRHVANIKQQLEYSQQSLVAFSQVVKGEVGTVYEDVSRLGQQLKTEVVEISHKHKTQLSQSLKRSKENTLQQWDKVKF